MAAGISRPDVWIGAAFNRDANDPNMPPIWTNLESTSTQVRKITGSARGRDYELAQPMATDPAVIVRDVNEYLNPSNPSSPYAGNLLPYRDICQLAQWPIAPYTPNTGNLINLNAWRGSRIAPYDPSFESYTVGADAPSWLDRYGGIVPLISAAGAFQGAQHVRYTTASTSTSYGLGFGAPVIPGRQYTASAYVKQTTASTQQIFAEGLLAVADQMRRTVTGGQGSPDASYAGTAYTTSGGAGSDYNVAAGQATQTNTSAGVARITLAPGSFHDSEQTILITAPVTATGDVYREGLVSRWVDANNYYFASLYFNTNSTFRVVIERVLAGVTTSLMDVQLPFTYLAGDQYWLSYTVSNASQEAHCWPIDKTETLIYTTGTVTDTSAALAGSGQLGFHSMRYPANTNANFTASFANYGAFGSLAGTSTTATGSYQRLSVTFTANQVARPPALDPLPLGKTPRGLSIVVRTVGTSVAGTVDYDAIQHEQAAAASAFTTTGPNIFPCMRNSIERYPRTWASRGYEGVTAMPSVDALASLNKIFFTGELTQAVLNAQPDYYYPLSGGTESLRWADASGNARPPLQPYVSKFGAGGALQPGSDASFAGNPGGSGIKIDRAPALNVGTILAGGAIVGDPGVLVPEQPATVWQMTVMGWVRATDPADGAGNMAVVRLQGRFHRAAITLLPTTVTFTLSNPVTSSASAVYTGTPMNDHWHMFLATVVQDATNTTVTIYDGDAVTGVLSNATSTVSTASVGGLPPSVMTTIEAAGTIFDYPFSSYGAILNGTITQAAVWNRALSVAEITKIFQAGSVAGSGETAGQRFYRHLQSVGYTGPTRIATGLSVMGPPTNGDPVDMLTDGLNMMAAEGGTLWVEQDGVVAFESRQDRWLRLIPQFTFGENEAGGEIPYQDGILFDTDPTYVYPVVTWTRNGGVTAVGGLITDRVAAARKFFPRQFDGNSDFASDLTAQNIADWIFYSHRAPLTRVDVIVVNPWASPTLWTKILQLVPGLRVTAIRRAKAANAGAGLTMSADYFIEKISTPEISFVQGEEVWTFELQLSPIGAGNAPAGPTMQPWILGDATYSVLGSTTVLGW